MKINGHPVPKVKQELLVLPRGDAQIPFRAMPVQDMDEFYKLCPEPTPPGKLTKEGWEPQINDPSYRTILEAWARKRLGYLVIRTLEPSNIEWDTVDVNNPKTWANWQDDFKNAGFTVFEVNLIRDFALGVNSLSEEKLAAARDAFLRGQAQQQESTFGQNTEPMSTPSGELASV